MKPLAVKPTSSLAIFLFLSVAQIASAFYDPSLGRWLNRDPIGDIGFRSLPVGGQTLVDTTANELTERLWELLKESSGPSSYSFVGNEPIHHIDPLGLLKFDGCSPDQQAKLTADFNSYCGNLKNSLTGCCKNETILPRLEHMCNNSQDITIKCVAGNTGNCQGACAWSIPGGTIIRFCPNGWNPGCGPLGCTLMHEMTHMIGHGGEKWPKQVEKCLGCP